jgi:hypothetical protein
MGSKSHRLRTLHAIALQLLKDGFCILMVSAQNAPQTDYHSA